MSLNLRCDFVFSEVGYVRVCRLVFVYFFFFFQAEDGIRDDLVTGETCALPICQLAGFT